MAGKSGVAITLLLLLMACSSCAGQSGARPTFTPTPRVPLPAGATPPPTASQPVVASTCLRGLSSYRFNGSLSLQTPAPAGTPAPGGESSGLAGSLANLLSHVDFNGGAVAPDRVQATISFGEGGPQTLELITIGPQTYSRFGNAAWQEGNQVAGLGNIAQVDPESVCERGLTQLNRGGQSPARETVNSVPSLRYSFTGTQASRVLFGGRGSESAPSASATPANGSAAQMTLWVAQKGQFPVRLQYSATQSGGSINLRVDVTNVNSKDIHISAPR